MFSMEIWLTVVVGQFQLQVAPYLKLKVVYSEVMKLLVGVEVQSVFRLAFKTMKNFMVAENGVLGILYRISSQVPVPNYPILHALLLHISHKKLSSLLCLGIMYTGSKSLGLK